MNVSKNELINAIKELVKAKSTTEVLAVVLPELNEEQLQSLIQTILDPTFKEKQEVFTDPQRFTKLSSVVTAINTELPNTVKINSKEIDNLKKQPTKSFDELREELNNPTITEAEEETVNKIKDSLLSQTGIVK